MEVDNENVAVEGELTEVESELYDRQIRLWGLESQKRLGKAKIFISGLSGVGAEIAKNILLAGVKQVVLHDDNIVTEVDCCSQFLAPRDSLGKNRAASSLDRARALNPMVELTADTELLSAKDEAYFKQFDVVVLVGASTEEQLRIDNICRQLNVKFFACDVWGQFGFSFADLQQHVFVEDVAKHKVVSKPNEKVKTELVTSTVQRELSFAPYSNVLSFDIDAPYFQKKVKRTGPGFVLLRILQKFRENFKRDPSPKTRETDLEELAKIRNEITKEDIVPNEYLSCVFAQISAAAAVVGGVLAQEVIKTVSKKEAPHCNVFLFDPIKCCGFIEKISA